MLETWIHADYQSPAVWDGLAAGLQYEFSPYPGRIFGHVICEPEWSWAFRPSDYVLWLVTEGRGGGRLEDQALTLGPGSLVVLRPGSRGQMYHDPTRRLTVTYVHFDFVRPGTSRLVRVADNCLPSSLLHLDGFEYLNRLLLRAVRCLQAGDAYSRLEAQLLVTQALLETYRQDAAGEGLGLKRPDPRVLRVMHKVRTDPAGRLPVATAARIAGTSIQYFRRLFHSETGTSYRNFVMVARMERAQVLLSESTLSVSAVAAALGYRDPALFSHQYRCHVGETPSQTRRNAEVSLSTSHRAQNP